MATLIDRVIYETESDADMTEGIIDLMQWQAALSLYDAGQVDAQFINDTFGMTVEQAAELDEILATRPATPTDLSTPLEILAAATWVQRMVAPCVAGYSKGGIGWGGFEHSDDVRGKLGLPV